MRRYKLYIWKLYVINFFLVLCGFAIFYVGIDYVQVLKKLLGWTNLSIIYIYYKFISSFLYIYPISVVLSFVLIHFKMVRSNEIIAIYSFGILRKSLARLLFFISLIMVLVYIVGNMTPLAYADSYSRNILNYGKVGKSETTGIFFKYNDAYIYIGSLDSYKKSASDISAFFIKDSDISKIIEAKTAIYDDERWLLKDATITTLIQDANKSQTKNSVEKRDTFVFLEGFNPDIVYNVFDSQINYSIVDSIKALLLFHDQNINITRVKTTILFLSVFPLFAPFLVVILFYYMPLSSRYANINIIMGGYILITAVLWGLLFLLSRLSFNGIIPPEIGILAPIVIMALYSFYIYIKKL